MSKLVVYNASAGSGKTYTLAREYILQIIRRPMEYRAILAVTFTNKATEEMKTRIIEELHALAKYRRGDGREPNYLSVLVDMLKSEQGQQQTLWDDDSSRMEYEREVSKRAQLVLTSILHDYSNFAISTIDKFFQKVVRNFVRELNIQPGYALELDSDRVLSLAVDKVLENLHEDEQLQRWLFDLVEERLNEGDSWELSGILTDLGRQLMREDFRQQPESFYEKIGDKEFLDTYYRKLIVKSKEAEREYKSIGKKAVRYLEGNGIKLEDIPGGSRSFATIFFKAMEGVVPSSYKSATDAFNNPDKWMGKSKPKMTDAVYSQLNPLLGKILDYIERECNTYAVAIKNFRTLGVLADIDRQVRELASEDNLLLISDTNHIINKLIEGSDAPFIYEKMGNRFGSYLIDEFQDTSKQQYANFKPLLENSIGEGGYAMVVGDVKQNIYRWRNGDWRTLGISVFEDFAPEKISLDTNFRSKRNVVEFNNAVFPIMANSLQQKMAVEGVTNNVISKVYEDVFQNVPDVESKRGGYIHIEKVNGDSALPDSSANELSSSDRAQLVMQKLVERITELQDERGYNPSDIAILVRRQSEGQMVAEALLEARNASVPEKANRFNFISQGALYLSSSNAVNLIVSILRLSINPTDSISAALVSYIEKLEKDLPIAHGYFESAISERVTALIERIANLPLPEAVEAIIVEYHLNEIVDELPFIGGFADVVLGFATQKVSDATSFVEWWDERGFRTELYLPNQEEAITIMTVHKSKGLQYKVVLIPFFNWDYEPATGNRKTTLWVSGEAVSVDDEYLEAIPVEYGSSLKKSAFAEDAFMEQLQSYIDNINLAYVALTRAEQELYLYIPKSHKKENIGTLLFDAAVLIPSATIVEPAEGEEPTTITFGKKGSGAGISAKDNSGNTISLTTYRIGKPLSKIKQSYSTTLAEGSGNLKKGLLMHRLFSLINTPADIDSALDTMVEEGLMVVDEQESIKKQVLDKLDNPTIAEWFNGKHTIVAEGDIILPGDDYRVRRPDRVMMNDRETVVVDFKFGEVEDPSHRYQVFGYINTLRKMGYPNVKGYIWYFDHDGVVELV
jgi:ATP-dependent exoDNAse (exonuclease V) beta subunit